MIEPTASSRPSFWGHPLKPICLAGPTGSGKSALAVTLAAKHGMEIVNVDAYQVYEGLPILTAQPSAAELAAVKHHLYAILPLHEASHAGAHARMVGETVVALQAQGKRALLVGGSGMYLKAITHGLNELPVANPELRANLETLSGEELASRLVALDPHAATHVNLANPRHVQRALEICILTGKPASELKSAWSQGPSGIDGLFLDIHRELLYARINARCQSMFCHGVLTEVAAVAELGPEALCQTASKAIGLRETLSYLADEALQSPLALQLLQDTISQNTRRYAKRQTSWFRGQTNLRPVNSPEAAETAFQELLTPP